MPCDKSLLLRDLKLAPTKRAAHRSADLVSLIFVFCSIDVLVSFYDGVRFFRVLDGFMAQFGINGDPKVSAVWREARIQDDPVRQ